MAFRKGVLFGVFMLALLVCAAAHADDRDPFDSSEPPDEALCYDMTGNLVWCSAEGTAGGDYTYCMAVGQWGQTCQDVMQPVGGGTPECVSVYRDGKCQCNAVTKKTTGTCTYRAR